MTPTQALENLAQLAYSVALTGAQRDAINQSIAVLNTAIQSKPSAPKDPKAKKTPAGSN